MMARTPLIDPPNDTRAVTSWNFFAYITPLLIYVLDVLLKRKVNYNLSCYFLLEYRDPLLFM